MRRWMVLLAMALVACAAIAGTAVAKQTDEDTITIVDLAVGDPNFSTLVSLVKAAGLDGTLSNPKVKLTLFAPTNAAFRKLERAVPGVTKALTDPKNRKLLVDVLKYHVVRSDFSSVTGIEIAGKNGKIGTLLGSTANAKIAVGLKNRKLTLSDSAGLNTATVVEVDVQVDNGAIQVIDQVLVPKSIAAALKKAGLIG